MKKVYDYFISRRFVKALRDAMVLSIPAVLAGCFAFFLSHIEVASYQSFLETFANGFILKFLTVIQFATIDRFSVLMLILLSYCYEKRLERSTRGMFPVVAISCYMALVTNIDDYVFSPDSFKSIDFFTSSNLLDVIIVTFISCRLFIFFNDVIFARMYKKTYSNGADETFNNSLRSILPLITVIVIAAVLNVVLSRFMGNSSLQEMLSEGLVILFRKINNRVFAAVVYVLLTQFFWFFGLHGGNVTNVVLEEYFLQDPSPILTQAFFYKFVLIGGCGSLLCMLVAAFICDRRAAQKKLCKMSILPLIFNSSEIMLYGFPVAFNIMYLIPFMFTPVVFALTSYAAMALGIVPCAVNDVAWTTPVFMSGYMATGSVAGVLLQAVNFALGVLIYLPFIKLDQKKNNKEMEETLEDVVQYIKDCEHLGETPCLSNLTGPLGYIANMLIKDFEHDFTKGENVKIHYQLQVNYDGTIFGVEALLRWKNKRFGYIYPPLTIAIAQELDMLDDLSYLTVEQVSMDSERLGKAFETPICVSLNFNALQLDNPELVIRMEQALKRYDLNNIKLGVEITEQYELSNSIEMVNRLKRLKELGCDIIMDDFGVGHSSLINLQNNHYDLVKLDGALVRDVLTNKRSQDIIYSIMHMSHNMGFEVLAEYVETSAQKEKLKELGCEIYQGYLFSKALPIEQAIDLIAEKYIK